MGCTVRGSDSDGGQDFPDASRSAPRPIHFPVQRVPFLFPGGKAAEA